MLFYGHPDDIYDRMTDILGRESKHPEKHRKKHGVEIDLKCIYTANSFYSDENDGKIINLKNDYYNQIFKNETAEFWDMLFCADKIEFKKLFYQMLQDRPNGINRFPFIDKIEFYNNETLTNILEWNTRGIKHWMHSAENGFHNLVNPQFLQMNYFI